jgi:hypothetical protein
VRLVVQPVRADDRRPHHGLRHFREHLADPRPRRVVCGREPALERPNDQRERDHQHHHADRQLPREDEHQRERAQHLEAGPDPRDASPFHELLHRVDVGGDPRDEDASFLLRLLGDRETMDVRERPDPEVRHRLFRRTDEATPRRATGHVGQRDDREADPTDGDHEVGTEPAVEAVVEDELDQDRRHEVGRDRPERDHHRERQAGSQRRALADPSAQHPERAAQILRDRDRVVVVPKQLHAGAHRSPRS